MNFGPKTAKFGPKTDISDHISAFWSLIDPMPNQETEKLLRWISVMWVPKLLLTPVEIRICPKTGKFGSFGPIPDQKTMETKVPRWFFHFMGTKTFGLKTAKFGPKMALLVKYCHFWPFWLHARKKNNASKVSRWFSVVYQNFFFLP